MGKLDKNTFVQIIKDMQEYEQTWDDLNTFFISHGADGYLQPNTALVDDLLVLLKDAMDDKNELISEFCISRNYGLITEKGSLKKIRTAQELYDCLSKEK